MMYSNKFVLAVKAKGKVLREFKDSVYVPFGTEYKLLLKNLNSKRASVKVEIDGKDVGDGTRFVIDANSEMELERFIRNGNLDQGNRFRFIERTAAVEKHRGIGAEDGLVRIEFQYERQIVWTTPTVWSTPHWPRRNCWGGLIGGGGGGGGLSGGGAGSGGWCETSVSYGGTSTVACNHVGTPTTNSNDVGITAAGSVSDQQFNSVSWFDVESDVHVIVMRLLGKTKENEKLIRRAVTVKSKVTCSSCGKHSPSFKQFCDNCGTSLQLV